MALRIYKIKEHFATKAEELQFNNVCNIISTWFPQDDYVYIISSYNVEGAELDALLISKYGFYILEFKNWGGNIIVRENGSWTSNGKTINGGSLSKNPFDQVRIYKSRLIQFLRNLSYNTIQPAAFVIFNKKSAIDNQLTETVQKWLHVCDMNSLETQLTIMKLNGEVLSGEELKSIPAKLKLEEFECDEDGNHHFEGIQELTTDSSENATSFYEGLESIIDDHAHSIKERYESLRLIFRRVIDCRLADVPLRFVSLFSQVDYIIKEEDISPHISHAIHETRKRLTAISEIPDKELSESLMYDIKSVALLVLHIFNVTIPSSLQKKLPSTPAPKSWGVFSNKLVRCKIVEWDDEFIYATEEQNGKEITVCYSNENVYLSRNGEGDWSYLKNILWKDAIINLVRVRFKAEIYYPELIIFEPDYLINVTTIASCFAEYAESPWVNLIEKLSIQPNSRHIHLGNLAGKFLDDTIHHSSCSFDESFMEYIRLHSINYVSCEDMGNQNEPGQFYNDAIIQRNNIKKIIEEDLPQLVGNYDERNVVLEPAFFSEVLGIQGRMDFLLDDEDGLTIIEQKSGKGGFVPFNDPNHDNNKPKVAEKHWVQLLLYRALEIYEFNKYETELNHIMLLYSKYNRGLVSTAQSPSLLLKAIEIRNKLAWSEILYTKDGLKIIENLTPEKLRKKTISDNLWLNYIRPNLESKLNIIKQASELEKAYYFRFMRFIEQEQLCAKLGTQIGENSGFASLWIDSFEDKKSSGNIYYGLSISEYGLDGDSIKSIALSFSDTTAINTSNFRNGDIILLYPYKKNEVPNACAQMVQRASIKKINTSGIEIELKNNQTDKKVFENYSNSYWAIEHDMFDSSFSFLYQSMFCFLNAKQERRDLILGQRKPEIDGSLKNKGNYGDFDELVERSKQSRDIFLVIGPPGTGKTSHGLISILKEERKSYESHILLMAYTNQAVDEICYNLNDQGIDFLRIGSELNCNELFHSNLLSTRVKSCRTVDEIRSQIRSARVICGTTAALNTNIGIFNIKKFNLAIVDEASQILEPQIIGLLSAKFNDGNIESNAIERIVLIGDHKQLPAVVRQSLDDSKVVEPSLIDIKLTDCRRSFFERFLSYFDNNNGGYDSRFVYMLTKQGRMHKDIAEFPNYAFYGNQLKIVPLGHQNLPSIRSNSTDGIMQLITSRRIAFICARSNERTVSLKTNKVEAEMIAATVLRIYSLTSANFQPKETLGIIVPYRNQISTIKKEITKLEIPELEKITIDTVERFQGSQRDYIIYGFTIRDSYQLRFLSSNTFFDNGAKIDRKLNVALTRAKIGLYLIGNPSLLAENYIFYKLLEFIRSKSGYFDIPSKAYCDGRFNVPDIILPDNIELTDDIYGLSNQFKNIFDEEVIKPIRDDYRTDWDNKIILGNSMDVNKNLINYGRIDFSTSQIIYVEHLRQYCTLSVSDQVLIYCFYIMRMHYCSAKTLYSSMSNWIGDLIHSHNGRCTMIDIGCGPATCGITFAEQFARHSSSLSYVGIEISKGMTEMAGKLLDGLETTFRKHNFTTSHMNISDNNWADISEVPALVVYNISYFFSNVNGNFTENLANNIIDVMKKYSLNKYIFVIQHSKYDAELRSYSIFKKCMASFVNVIKYEESKFAYKLSGDAKELPFCYEIWESK